MNLREFQNQKAAEISNLKSGQRCLAERVQPTEEAAYAAAAKHIKAALVCLGVRNLIGWRKALEAIPDADLERAPGIATEKDKVAGERLRILREKQAELAACVRGVELREPPPELDGPAPADSKD